MFSISIRLHQQQLFSCKINIRYSLCFMVHCVFDFYILFATCISISVYIAIQILNGDILQNKLLLATELMYHAWQHPQNYAFFNKIISINIGQRPVIGWCSSSAVGILKLCSVYLFDYMRQTFDILSCIAVPLRSAIKVPLKSRHSDAGTSSHFGPIFCPIKP